MVSKLSKEEYPVLVDDTMLPFNCVLLPSCRRGPGIRVGVEELECRRSLRGEA